MHSKLNKKKTNETEKLRFRYSYSLEYYNLRYFYFQHYTPRISVSLTFYKGLP